MTPAPTSVPGLSVAGRALAIGLGIVLAASCGGPDRSAAEYMTRAGVLVGEGKTMAAVIELKNALELEPRNAGARVALGSVYLTLGYGASAEKEFKRALELGRRDPEAFLGLTRAIMLERRMNEVLDRLENVPDGVRPATVRATRADALLGLDRVDAAAVELEAGFGEDPWDADVQRGLARVAWRRGRLDEAAQHLERARQAQPEALDTLRLSGELELARGRFDAALAAFDAALKISNNDRAARVGAARAYLAKGDPDGAQQQIEAFARDSGREPIVSFLRALVARQRGDTDRAQVELREVLSMVPNHAQSLFLLAHIDFVRQRYWSAEELLRRFLAQQPRSIAARKLLGAVFLGLGETERAVQALLEAREMAPDDLQVLSMLGDAYMRAHDFDRASRYLEEAAQSEDPFSSQARLALVQMKGGSVDGAAAALETAALTEGVETTRASALRTITGLLRRDVVRATQAAEGFAAQEPDNPVAHALLGAAHEARGDLQSARRQYERALELEPDYVRAALYLARLDLRLGNGEAVQERYRSMLARQPDQPDALVGLAGLASRAGRGREAYQLLQRARRANPWALEPRLVLAAYLTDRRDHDAALELAREAAAISPGEPRALLVLVNALVAAGQAAEAVAAGHRLAERVPGRPEAHLALARALRGAGDGAGAIAALERALALNPSNLDALDDLGRIALAGGDLDKVALAAERLRSGAPDDPRGLLLEGDLLTAQGKPQEAAAAFERAAQLGGDAEAVLRQAAARRQNGDLSGSLTVLREWLVEHPDDTAVRMALARGLSDLGDPAAAQGQYEAIVAASPAHAAALYALARLYLDNGDARVLDVARRAHDAAPDDAAAMSLLGTLMVERDNAQQGLELLQRAVRRAHDAGDPALARTQRFLLARALASIGQLPEAERELDALLGSGEPFAEREEAAKLARDIELFRQVR